MRDQLDDEDAFGVGAESAGWVLMGVDLASLATSIILFFAIDGEEAAEGQPYVAPFTREGWRE